MALLNTWLRRKNLRILAKILVILTIAAIPAFPAFACTPQPISLDDYYHLQIKALAHPYAFDYVKWEFDIATTRENDVVPKVNPPLSKKDLMSNILKVLTQEGIKVFPPLNIYFGKPPLLLVVSPRDRVEYFDRAVLSPDLVLPEIVKLESSIESLGPSCMVTDLGGFGGVYPPIVAGTPDLNYMINAGVEEWLHQYMALRPLGLRYLLDSVGIPQDPDVITMNETAVGIVSREIGNEVYAKYYAESWPKPARTPSSFDFDTEMREARAHLDMFLARGDIQGGQNYLEMERRVFESNGYYIRKLNQAYFAFHGIYGYDPAAVSPIYSDLQKLRAGSASLRAFLDNVAAMNSYADLLKAVNKLN
jgi:hypothetical protein